MEDILEPLQKKEKELREKLEQIPMFNQWQGLRSTIILFQNGASKNSSKSASTQDSSPNNIPGAFTDDLTWKKKILFVLNKLSSAYVSEIITELKQNGEPKDEEFLEKRISTMASNMKRNKILGAKFIGNKAKYFIR